MKEQESRYKVKPRAPRLKLGAHKGVSPKQSRPDGGSNARPDKRSRGKGSQIVYQVPDQQPRPASWKIKSHTRVQAFKAFSRPVPKAIR